jgi:hypothetical protein
VLRAVRVLRVVLPQAGARAREAHGEHLPWAEQVGWPAPRLPALRAPAPPPPPPPAGGCAAAATVSQTVIGIPPWSHPVGWCLPAAPRLPTALAHLPVLRRPETGLWATPFDYCRAVCRTTARSTQHENAFILDRKHCFSKVALLGHILCSPPPAGCQSIGRNHVLLSLLRLLVIGADRVTPTTTSTTTPAPPTPRAPPAIDHCSWAVPTCRCRLCRRCRRTSMLWQASRARAATWRVQPSRWRAAGATLPA